MNATQEAKLDQALGTIATVKQLLTETEQWKGIGWLVSETYKQVGEIRQAIYAKESDGPGSWDGIAEALRQIEEQLDTISVPNIDLDALAAKIIAGLPTGTAGPTAQEIAQTTRELFSTQPLK